MDKETRERLFKMPTSCYKMEYFLESSPLTKTNCTDAVNKLHSILRKNMEFRESNSKLRIPMKKCVQCYDGEDFHTIHIENESSIWIHSYDPDDSWGQQTVYNMKF
jgi:hypothetical protein